MLMYRRAARSAYRNAACVVSVSSALAQRAISTGADAASVCVVPNGIDPSEIGWDASFDTERWPRHGPLKLLFVGRLVAEKAIDVLLRAVAKLPRSEFVVDIVGDGERKNDLMALSRKLKINESVTFHGNRKRSALGSFYRDSDIVCLPSLSEAQPVVTLEAMVAGKPVIASRVGGVPDSVQHDFNGMLVNPNNADELADAIRKLADNAPLRERMGMQARSRLSEFAWPQILLRFESAIHNLRNEQTAVSGEQSHWGS